MFGYRLCSTALLLLIAASCAQPTSTTADYEEPRTRTRAAGGGGSAGGTAQNKAGTAGQLPGSQGGSGAQAPSTEPGSAGTGGSLPLAGAGPGGCVIGELANCADVHPQFPKGTTTCDRDGFPTTTCRFCEAGDTIACAEIPGNDAAPYGTASCDPAGDFAKGAFAVEDCAICEPGVTQLDCLELPDQSYTGGQAVCNPSGDGWLAETCTVCGDGTQNGVLEQCDGTDVTPTTCGALDFGGTDPATPVTACAANCNYDTSECGHCAGGVAAGDCMESGSCTGTECDGKGCARDASCQFLCRDSATNKCSYPVCSEGASCRFDCYNQGGCLSAQCREGASCQFACQNQLAECLDILCEDGASCDLSCSDGGTCTTAEPVHCKTGDECMLTCTNGGHCAGVEMICEAGSICHLHLDNSESVPQVECQTGSICHLHCAGADCASVQCTGSGCHCDGGTCPGFP